jgi:hypothetical protein
MDRVTLFATCLVGVAALSTSVSAAGMPTQIDQWQGIIDEAAGRFGIPDTWIRGVMQAESGGRTQRDGRPIISPKGAMGLMQVMPDTYRTLRIQYGLGSNAYDPHDNIFAGAAYLRQMYDRYGYPSLFAAYNAGPKRLEDFLFGGRALPRETLDYVGNIVPGAVIAFSPTATTPMDFVPSASDVSPSKPLRDGLFFDRKDVKGSTNPSAEVASNMAAAHGNAANFAATNSAALFVPLSTTAQ